MNKADYTDLSHSEIIAQKMTADGCRESEVKEMLDQWAETQKLIPEDFDELRDSKNCCFCVDEVQEASGFAHTVMAHKEPVSYKGLLGLGKPRFESEVGSILPVHIPICSRCRRAIRKAHALKPAIMALFVLIGVGALFVLFNLLNIEQSTKAKIIIYSGLVLFEILGYVISIIIADRYVENHSKHVHFNIFDIEMIGRMREKGWFLFQDNSAATSVSFRNDSGDFGKVFDK